jgi:hypothetical protein
MDFALSLTGHTAGGPGKVAVVSSSLFGTVSGSAVANVLVDGPITIPLMKRTGFRPAFAAAVESVASTGGQIMPPIMGAAAFVMAEFLAVSYLQVALWAFIPALLYYLAVFCAVHFEAKRVGLLGLPRSECRASRRDARARPSFHPASRHPVRAVHGLQRAAVRARRHAHLRAGRTAAQDHAQGHQLDDDLGRARGRREELDCGGPRLRLRGHHHRRHHPDRRRDQLHRARVNMSRDLLPSRWSLRCSQASSSAWACRRPRPTS